MKLSQWLAIRRQINENTLSNESIQLESKLYLLHTNVISNLMLICRTDKFHIGKSDRFYRLVVHRSISMQATLPSYFIC